MIPPPRPTGVREVSGCWSAGDDREEVVRKRLTEYAALTAPLVAYYGNLGLLRRVDGVGALDEVTQSIFRSIGVQQ
jgi:adenylate kinase